MTKESSTISSSRNSTATRYREISKTQKAAPCPRYEAICHSAHRGGPSRVDIVKISRGNWRRYVSLGLETSKLPFMLSTLSTRERERQKERERERERGDILECRKSLLAVVRSNLVVLTRGKRMKEKAPCSRRRKRRRSFSRERRFLSRKRRREGKGKKCWSWQIMGNIPRSSRYGITFGFFFSRYWTAGMDRRI